MTGTIKLTIENAMALASEEEATKFRNMTTPELISYCEGTFPTVPLIQHLINLLPDDSEIIVDRLALRDLSTDVHDAYKHIQLLTDEDLEL